MTAPVLRTERLELRPFARADADPLHALFTDADVRRYLLDGDVVPRAWVLSEIEASERRFGASGCGLWTIREHGAEEIVGFVGFRPFFDPPELQLLYGLLPTRWGRGLATEAASAVIVHAVETLRIGEILAATDAPNRASVAVLERLGFAERRRTDDGPAGTVFFGLSAERWRAGAREPTSRPR